jgi:hypothetical protein
MPLDSYRQAVSLRLVFAGITSRACAFCVWFLYLNAGKSTLLARDQMVGTQGSGRSGVPGARLRPPAAASLILHCRGGFSRVCKGTKFKWLTRVSCLVS